MSLFPRALALGLVLTAVPQAPRTALGRCVFTATPAAVYKLPDALTEVSGLAVGPGGTLLTHGDERGRITVIDGATLNVVRVVDLQGIPRDDFEGIAAAGDSVALMSANGRLYLFRLGATSPVPFTWVETGLGRVCELEGLAWHRDSGTLLLPCKEERAKRQGGITVFRYRLGPTRGFVPPIVVSAAQLSKATGFAQVRPTSVEVDAATGNLIVLSSRPRMLIEVDSTGRVVAVQRLAAQQHPQPEGLTLTADALWVADEGAGRKGSLAKYVCK